MNHCARHARDTLGCPDCRDANGGRDAWWRREGLSAPCPNWRPESRRCNCKDCRVRRRIKAAVNKAAEGVASRITEARPVVTTCPICLRSNPCPLHSFAEQVRR